MIKKVILLQNPSVAPFNGKTGDTNKVGLKIKNTSGEEVWINGFMDVAPQWNAGDEVTVDIYPKEYNGKTYWNFKVEAHFPNPTRTEIKEIQENPLETRVLVLEQQMKELLKKKEVTVEDIEKAFDGKEEKQQLGDYYTPDRTEISVDDIPF